MGYDSSAQARALRQSQAELQSHRASFGKLAQRPSAYKLLFNQSHEPAPVDTHSPLSSYNQPNNSFHQRSRQTFESIEQPAQYLQLPNGNLIHITQAQD